MNSMVTNRTKNNKDWFDFDKFIGSVQDNRKIEYCKRMESIHKDGIIVRDSVEIRDIMVDCVFYEVSKMWWYFNKFVDVFRGWYSPKIKNVDTQDIHFGVSDSFVSDKEVRFYYKTTNYIKKSNPFLKNDNIKFYLGNVSLRVSGGDLDVVEIEKNRIVSMEKVNRPLKPTIWSLSRQIAKYGDLVIKVFALEFKQALEIFDWIDEDLRGKQIDRKTFELRHSIKSDIIDKWCEKYISGEKTKKAVNICDTDWIPRYWY